MPITPDWLVVGHTGGSVWPALTTATTYTWTSSGTLTWPTVNVSSTTSTGGWITQPTMNAYNYTLGLHPGYDAPDYDAMAREIDRMPLRRDMDLGYAPIQRSADQLERQRRNEARHAARVTAADRATGLLLSMLTPEQRHAYQDSGSFEVIGSAGGRYRINKGTAGNVEWFDPATGRVAAKLCAHPSMHHDEGWIPEQDVAVGQMLALMTDEPEFVRIANVHAGRRPTFERTWRNRLRVA